MKPLFTKFNRKAWILMALFFAFGVMTTSCSDDDDDDNGSPNEQNNNNNGNEAQEGSYNVTLEGDVSGEMSGGQAIFSREAMGDNDKYDSTEDAALVISLADPDTGDSRQITVAVYKPNADRVDAGTYDIALQNESDLQIGSNGYFYTQGGAIYSVPSQESQVEGNVELASVTETDVEGQLNDVYMRKIGLDTTKTITLNGAFHAKRVQ